MLVFEVIFVFPILFVLYQKNPKLTLFSAIAIDIIYQIFAFYVNTGFYSECILRYISALTIGLWISEQDFDLYKPLKGLKKIQIFLSNHKIFVIFSLIGFFYILIWFLFYKGYLISLFYPIPFFNSKYDSFSFENVFTFGFTAFLIVLGLIIFPDRSNNYILNKLGFLGKASYHIFLIQILYFHIFSFADVLSDTSFINKLLIILGDLSVCIIFGVGFYYLEKRVYNFLSHLAFEVKQIPKALLDLITNRKFLF